MSSSPDTILILHGWGGNKPAHWQEHLAAALQTAGATVHYPKFPEPGAPDLQAWLSRLDEAVAQIAHPGPPLTVVCHSLGAITWMHYAKRAPRPQFADRVLLVAPPYVVPEAPPSDAPPGVEGFFPPPLDPGALAYAACETHLVASDTDDYATFDQSKAYADRLQIPIHLLKGAGHISPYYGYGEWPWVLDWCLRRAALPPQPRSAADGS
jgi:hypothetical protein